MKTGICCVCFDPTEVDDECNLEEDEVFCNDCIKVALTEARDRAHKALKNRKPDKSMMN